MGWQMEIPEYLDMRELYWAQKECHGGQSSSGSVLRARSPIDSDAKLAGWGQIILCKLSALALWNALWRTSKQSEVIIPTHLPSVLGSVGCSIRESVGACLASQLGVAWDWRGLGPLWVGGGWICFAGLQILACTGGRLPTSGQDSTGRASPSFSYVGLLSLLVSVATKLCQAFPVGGSEFIGSRPPR
eukprot:1140428-Pelagomonas_calceolata.AAC.3